MTESTEMLPAQPAGQLIASGTGKATSVAPFVIAQVPSLSRFFAIKTLDELSELLSKAPECAKPKYRTESPEAKRLALNSLLTDTYIATNSIADFVQTLVGGIFSALYLRDYANPRYASFYYQQDDLLQGKKNVKPMPAAPFTGMIFNVIGSARSGKSKLANRLHELLGDGKRLRCQAPVPDVLTFVPGIKLEWNNKLPDFLRQIRYVLRAQVANANAKDRLLKEIESESHGPNAVKSWFVQLNVGVITIDGCCNKSLNKCAPDVLRFIADLSKWTGIPIVILGTPIFMHRLANEGSMGAYLTSGPKLDLDEFKPPVNNKGTLDQSGSWYATVEELWHMCAMSKTKMHEEFPVWAYEHGPIFEHLVYGLWDFMRNSISLAKSDEPSEASNDSGSDTQDKNKKPAPAPRNHPATLEASNLTKSRVLRMMAHTSKMSTRLRIVAYQMGATGHLQSEKDFKKYPDYVPSGIITNPDYDSWIGSGITDAIRAPSRSIGVNRLVDASMAAAAASSSA